MSNFDLRPEFLREDLYPFLEIKDYEITSQSGYPRGSGSIGKNRGEHTWKFVLPNEIAENISHNWEEYESMATRISQKVGEIHKAARTGKQLWGKLDNIPTGESIDRKNWLRRAAVSSTNINLAQTLNYRIDSTLMYKSSERREYTFTLELAETIDVDYITITNSVKNLELLSTPENTGDIITINFPSIFSVKSSAGSEYIPTIFIEHAALTAVQPTWKAPYRNGYPTQVDLQLTFKDIDPLFRTNFQNTFWDEFVPIETE